MGQCHHSIVRPRVVVGGTASNIDGSCECIEYAVADSRKGGDPPALGLDEVLTIPHRKNMPYYATDTFASGLD